MEERLRSLRNSSSWRFYLAVFSILILALTIILSLAIVSSGKNNENVTVTGEAASLISSPSPGSPSQVAATATVVSARSSPQIAAQSNHLFNGQLSQPTSAGITEQASSPLPVQPLPISVLPTPLGLVLLTATKENGNGLVKQLLAIKAVQSGRFIPVEYVANTNNPNPATRLLAIVPLADENLYKNLSQVEFKLLDNEADTTRYYRVTLPDGSPPPGEGWLDSNWRILDQTGNSVLIKTEVPFFTGFGIHTKPVYNKLPPRIHVPGLTLACPCPALATATFATVAPQLLQNAKLTEAELRNQQTGITQENLKKVTSQIVANEVPGKGALNSRYTGHSGSVYIAERIYTYFFALGLKVEYDTFVEGGLGSVTTNVIAEQAGDASGATAETVVIVAHYDSLGVRNLQGISDPKVPAYGANDNAVGVAGLFEIARSLASYRLKQPVRYIAFGAEEQAMLGSQHYVSYHLENERLRAVLNIDSFGYNPGEEDWVILVTGTYGGKVRDVLQANQKKYQIGLRLDARAGEPFFRSDDYYFDRRGYPAIALTDSFNLQSPNNHTANDTVQNVNFRTSQKVIQLALVTVAELSGF
jgi:hypothetical protein